jgi:hypothetical protein
MEYYLNNWTDEVPEEVWLMLADWGYFGQDINLTDALRATTYLLNRINAEPDPDDYYANLKITDYKQYLNIKVECIYFLFHFKSTERGKLESL